MEYYLLHVSGLNRYEARQSHRQSTHWGRMMHICVRKLTFIGWDNGLSPGRRQAIIWTNAGILLIWPLGTNFNEILIGIHTFSFKKMHLKMSSAKWRPFCLGLNVLKPSVGPDTYGLRSLVLICVIQPNLHKQWYSFMWWHIIEHVKATVLNSLRPRPNRRHFADDIFKCIFENENEWFSPRISLKFVSKVRFNNIPALVQIMAWRRPGDKPLSEPMMVSLLTHICVTRLTELSAFDKSVRAPSCSEETKAIPKFVLE